MNLTQTWIESSWMKALGWTFVHSIWQIALIGLLLFMVLRCIPGRSAHTRYTISTLALWTTLITGLCTFIVMLPQEKSITEVSGQILFVATTKPTSVSGQLSAWLETRIPMMLTIWLGGVAILMLRLAISLGWVSYIRRDSFAKEELQETLDHIIRRIKLNIRPFVSESTHIQSPVTIGHLKPLILFPIGIINQLSPKEVEAILTHELAHIVRRDYLSNLIQSFIETLFYYHPVTWWISGIVRTERENRADDLAVSWCGDHLGYAKALMTIQEMQMQHAPHLTVGFASRRGALLARIQRILNLPYKNHNQMEKTVLLSLCSLCFLAFTLNSQAHDDRPQVNTNVPVAFTIEREYGMDSIPATGTYKIHKKTDTQDISIEVQDGDVRELKIDGKEIAPAQFNEYDKVIEELFGSIETPPSMDGFEMPAMPPMPVMPPMAPIEGFHFMMPPMPDMPRRAQMDYLKDLEILNRYDGVVDDGSLQYRIITDSIMGGKTKVIIINENDSTIVYSPHLNGSEDSPAFIDLDGLMMNDVEMKKWAEEYHRNAEIMGKEWKAQAEQWQEQAQQWKEEWRTQHDNIRQEQNRYPAELNRYREEHDRLREEQLRWIERNESHNRNWKEGDLTREEVERELADQLSRGKIYMPPSPRMSLSDEMVRDGLIQPGQEVEVQLTPGKLKINGHKQSDELHEKYLRMYEHQQGIELSGNSRVEFTAKSRQRM